MAREAFTGREIRLWRDDLRQLDRAPWDTGPRSVTVAYFASAEFGCFRALGWPDPVNVIDLFAEFRCRDERPAAAPRQEPSRRARLLRPLRHVVRREGIDARADHVRRAMDAFGEGRDPRLLRRGCRRHDAPPRRHGASTGGASAPHGPRRHPRPLYGCRGRHGAHRHPDRCSDLRIAQIALARHPGCPYSGNRPRLRRL